MATSSNAITDPYTWIIVACMLILTFVIALISFVLWRKGAFTRRSDNSSNQTFNTLESIELNHKNTSSEPSTQANVGSHSVDNERMHRRNFLEYQIKGKDKHLNPSLSLNEQYNLVSYNKFRDIDRSQFLIDEMIGSGNFGEVYKGKIILTRKNAANSFVAIKTANNPTEDEAAAFFGEIKIMSHMNHHMNVINMIASCTSEYIEHAELWLLLEYCQHGDLKQFLIEHRSVLVPLDHGKASEGLIDTRIFVYFCYDIAKGMEYLANKNIMHGDLAARNILIGSSPIQSRGFVAKVADFGLSKTFYKNIRYVKKKRVFVPWKWMAPEYLINDYFTITSDVWSFGIVTWEIFSLGQSPYQGKDYNDLTEFYERGERLSCPNGATKISTWGSKELYKNLSNICFEFNPEIRRNFSDVIAILESELSEEELDVYKKMCDEGKKQYLKKVWRPDKALLTENKHL